jgi:transcription initiation factor TFIIIB Brf1 subunit/transcription initiation factor TFIIB
MWVATEHAGMYRAGDERIHEEWLGRLDRAADRLDLGSEARSRAADLFLSTVGDDDEDRTKAVVVAAALYVGSLAAGERRSQGAVAEAVGVSRLAVQGRWKEMTRRAGLEPPSW